MFKDDLLKGRRVLVTGGGSGLGRAMAERILEVGGDVAICGRRGAVLAEAADVMQARFGRTIATHVCDIRDAEAVGSMVDTLWRDGPITDLINNAAGNFISRTEDLTPRGFDAIANIVLHGTFYVTQACGKRWLKEGIAGSVVSIVTTWVHTGSAYTVPSAMSKAGVAAMTRSLAVEWGPRGIRLNAIAPGPFPTEGAWARLMPKAGDTRSNLNGTEAIPLRRLGDHRELANLAAFLLSQEVGYITGEVIAIDGGQWLNTAGTFASLAELSDAEWVAIREMIKASNAKDKARRDV